MPSSLVVARRAHSHTGPSNVPSDRAGCDAEVHRNFRRLNPRAYNSAECSSSRRRSVRGQLRVPGVDSYAFAIGTGMSMPSYERFKLALQRIDGAQWRRFETLANVFLSDEFPSLRPMASPSGDEGMDAQLFRPTDDDGVVLQFSVRKDWDTKIKETCKRLKETAPDVSMLIDAMNHMVVLQDEQAKEGRPQEQRLLRRLSLRIVVLLDVMQSKRRRWKPRPRRSAKQDRRIDRWR